MSLSDSMALWWGKIFVELIWAGVVLGLIVAVAVVKFFIVDAVRDKRKRSKK